MAYAFPRTGKGPTKYTGVYVDPEGVRRSAGTHASKRAALRAAQREEQRVAEGRWHDVSRATIKFRHYVQSEWLPSKHIELTTRAAYGSYLSKHFYPFFGEMPLGRIRPSTVQDWVTQASAGGLSARSVRKYHVLLHSIFARAVRDGLLLVNPCEHTELPKVVTSKTRTPTPEEFDRLLAAVPVRHRALVETVIETGVRWGEAIAFRPRHIDFLRRTITVEETIVEIPKKQSPTGERMVVKPYPKDNEARTFGVRQGLLDTLADHIDSRGIGQDDLLFATESGTPISRNTFRTRVWLPAVKASGLGFKVRMHDLRHAHATWLLAGGSDLKAVMDRMGHAQIQTTQKYLHAQPDHDQKNLAALNRATRRAGMS